MRQWKIRTQNENTVAQLCSALRCSRFFARVLCNRGINTAEKARAFLSTGAGALLDPYLFSQMRPIVERICEAIRGKEKILVYGDYDVDGITATSLLVQALRDCGGDALYYIPSRFTEGYGLNVEAVHWAAEHGVQLLITVDTGITAVQEVEEARRLGIDVVITDHHECQNTVPNAPILNPKYPASGYPFSELAGVGVVYKLACALADRYGVGSGADRYAPLAAVGTVSDIMSMTSENRYIVRQGLKGLKSADNPGMNALIQRCIGSKPIDTAAIGFLIAPRINAAGRLGNAEAGVELLTTQSEARAAEIVEYLCKENLRRQEIENQILNEAIEMIECDPAQRRRSAIVLWSENWHNGVVGIVASRLKDRYGKPCILFSLNEGQAKGSGRSIRPFNLFEALQKIGDITERFGGHAYAAGVLVTNDCLEEFREAFCAQVDQFLRTNRFDDSIEIDCALTGADLSLEQVRALEQLAPFGRDNEIPVFCMRNITLLDAAPTANRNHMRLTLLCGANRITAFYFNMPPERFPFLPGECIDAVFETDINTYNGRQSVQLLIKDLRCCDSSRIAALQEINRMERGRITAEDIPSRAHTAAVYLHIKSREAQAFDLAVLPAQIEAERKCRITLGRTYYALKILKELGILDYRTDQTSVFDLIIHDQCRADLDQSVILKNIKRKAGVNHVSGGQTV